MGVDGGADGPSPSLHQPDSPLRSEIGLGQICVLRDDGERGGASHTSPITELRLRERTTPPLLSPPPHERLVPTAEMIGNTVEAVRKMREEAARLACRLAEAHASDARGLREGAERVKRVVADMEGEVQIVEGQLAQLPGGVLSWAAAGQEASLIATAVAIAWGTMGFLEWWRGQVAAAGRLVAGPARERRGWSGGGVVGLAALLAFVGRRKSDSWRNMALLVTGQHRQLASLRDKWQLLAQRMQVLHTLTHPEAFRVHHNATPGMQRVGGNRELPIGRLECQASGKVTPGKQAIIGDATSDNLLVNREITPFGVVTTPGNVSPSSSFPVSFPARVKEGWTPATPERELFNKEVPHGISPLRVNGSLSLRSLSPMGV